MIAHRILWTLLHRRLSRSHVIRDNFTDENLTSNERERKGGNKMDIETATISIYGETIHL